jgi:hypothetical protein
LKQLRQLVAGTRSRLAGLETDYTREKSRVDAMQAVLFRRLREHYQKRDRLRLIVDYRKKFLDSLVRGGDEEAKQAEANYAKARAQTEEAVLTQRRKDAKTRSRKDFPLVLAHLLMNVRGGCASTF